MRKPLLAVVVAGLLASSANAALLFLSNAEDGGSTMDLAPGGTGTMNIMLTVRHIDEVDFAGFAFANVFLNDENDFADGKLNVHEVISGFPEGGPEEVVYDRDGFVLPADISWNQNNEYGLLMGRVDGGSWGEGTYVLDQLVIINDSDSTEGEKPVTFEKGGRAPHIFAGNLALYQWGFGSDNIIGGFADPGVGAEDNPFMINNVPEPATLAVVALGGLALLRRRA